MLSDKLPDIDYSDDYLWDKLQAAESDVRASLGVPLQPTEFFAGIVPTQAQIAALDGRPYQLESGLDLPSMRFGSFEQPAFRMRERPLLTVSSFGVYLPTQGAPVIPIDTQWLTLDQRGGIVSIVARFVGVAFQQSAVVANVFMAGTPLPGVVRVQYTAGMTPDHPQFKDVVDVTQRLAGVRLMQDAMTPQSGSISTDGMSESSSLDVAKFEDSVNATLSRLRDTILGPVWGVL